MKLFIEGVSYATINANSPKGPKEISDGIRREVEEIPINKQSGLPDSSSGTFYVSELPNEVQDLIDQGKYAHIVVDTNIGRERFRLSPNPVSEGVYTTC